MTDLLSARRLTLVYDRGTPVLHQVGAAVHEGEILCLIGPNGGGKTTLLRSLAGLMVPREGMVFLQGQPLYGRHPVNRQERAQQLAVVLTQSVSPAYLRVRELVALGRLPYPRDSHRDTPIVEEALHLSGIAHLAERSVGYLSDGERQRVMVARALAQQPRILLLDEPTSHLDPPHQTELFSLLQRLLREGVIDSVVLATHQLHLALHFADRLLLVASGAVRSGSPVALLESGELENAFAGTVEQLPMTLDPQRGWFVPTPPPRYS